MTADAGAGQPAVAPLPGAAGTLIVGYGNPLRGDDGLGWHAATRLAEDPRLLGASVLWQHQLTPELAVDVSNASLVVLIDAADGPEPGSIGVVELAGPGPNAPPDESGSTWSHHIDPASLAALARELWGAAPPLYVVSVGAADLELGEQLSAVVELALPGVIEVVVRLVAEHGRATTG